MTLTPYMYLLTGLEVLNIQASEQRKISYLQPYLILTFFDHAYIFAEIEEFAHKYMDALKQGPSSAELSADIDGNFSRPINVDEFTRSRIIHSSRAFLQRKDRDILTFKFARLLGQILA